MKTLIEGGWVVAFNGTSHMEEYCKTPVQFLADIGFLDTRTLLGHSIFTTAHPFLEPDPLLALGRLQPGGDCASSFSHPSHLCSHELTLPRP